MRYAKMLVALLGVAGQLAVVLAEPKSHTVYELLQIGVAALTVIGVRQVRNRTEETGPRLDDGD